MKIRRFLVNTGLLLGAMSLVLSACATPQQRPPPRQLKPAQSSLSSAPCMWARLPMPATTRRTTKGWWPWQRQSRASSWIELENLPESADAERVMENMIQQGAKVIFPQSFGYLDPALAVAERHPDVIFMHPAGFSNWRTTWAPIGATTLRPCT